MQDKAQGRKEDDGVATYSQSDASTGNAVFRNFHTKEKSPERTKFLLARGVNNAVPPEFGSYAPLIHHLNAAETSGSNRRRAFLPEYNGATFVHGARALSPAALSLQRPMHYSSPRMIYSNII